MAVLVLGHKNPDTDSIISAIAAADLMNKRGMTCKPVAQGAPTPETKFVLDKFGLSAPEVVTSVAGQKVMLVDYSDLAQAPADLKDAEIVAVVTMARDALVHVAVRLERFVVDRGMLVLHVLDHRIHISMARIAPSVVRVEVVRVVRNGPALLHPMGALVLGRGTLNQLPVRMSNDLGRVLLGDLVPLVVILDDVLFAGLKRNLICICLGTCICRTDLHEIALITVRRIYHRVEGNVARRFSQ